MFPDKIRENLNIEEKKSKIERISKLEITNKRIEKQKVEKFDIKIC